jgi:DNA-binding MarR family transcriptional regulator
MGANRRFTTFSVEGIVSAMREGRRYQVGNLARAYGAKPADVRRMLSSAVDLGFVVKVRDDERGEHVYSLPQSAVRDERTAPPYRNLHLTEDLTGYDSSLFRFANLCMMVRR